MDKKIGMAVVIIGLAFLSAPFFRHAKDVRQAEEYIEEIGADGGAEAGQEGTGGGEAGDEPKAVTCKKKASKEMPERAIGIIEIESLGLRYPIFEGTGSEQLNTGIGHLTESAGLLEKGNCVLAGHNGSRSGTFFTNLSKIEIGAEVVITDKCLESHAYEVVNTEIVDPYDESVRAESREERLTLFTCAYHGTQRFVCLCRPAQGSSGSAEGHGKEGGTG